MTYTDEARFMPGGEGRFGFPKESEKFFTLAPSAWLSERP